MPVLLRHLSFSGLPFGGTERRHAVQIDPHQFWQDFAAPGSFPVSSKTGHGHFYPATLPDGRQLALPLRVLPGDGDAAVASLIINQASFAVEDGLAEVLAEMLSPIAPQVVVGVPTLGLTLAANVARRLGHSRLVPLGTSRKFWYDDALSVPLRSITTPGGGKSLYLDPRLVPLIAGRRVAVIDDVISTGQSMRAALDLLEKVGVEPVAIGCAMLQGETWRDALTQSAARITSPLRTPRFRRKDGLWFA